MIKDDVNNDYFTWLFDIACGNRYSGNISYKKLLMYMHKKVFRYSIPMDANRAEDGLDLRYRFSLEYSKVENADEYIKGPCSILEMMIALSIRCEENIMDDPSMGNRTRQWFWEMVSNLGLGSMSDDRFDRKFVENTLETFLNREYEPNGKGGLFIIRNCEFDLRTVEIWHQLCWYLDDIV